MHNFEFDVESPNNENDIFSLHDPHNNKVRVPKNSKYGLNWLSKQVVLGFFSLCGLTILILAICLVYTSMIVTTLQKKMDGLMMSQHWSMHDQMSTNADFRAQLVDLEQIRNNISVEFAGDVTGCGATWISYKHEKCFKILDRLFTHDEAEAECLKEFPGQNSKMIPLLTIDSTQEQQFLNRFVFVDSKILDNVWLGAQRETKGNESIFLWKFGTGNRTGSTADVDFHFENWQESRPSSTLQNRCVHMTPHGTRVSSGWSHDVDGLWQDAPCLKRNVAVCQKSQVFSLANLKSYFVEFKKETTRKIKSLEKTGSVPLGFIYIQYRNQSAPTDLWPQLKWEEVTDLYSGEFFRALDNGSSSFGEIQNGNAPRVIKIEYKVSEPGRDAVFLPVGSESLNIATAPHEGYGTYRGSLSFFTSGGEVRPRNSAIKIWKRI